MKTLFLVVGGGFTLLTVIFLISALRLSSIISEEERGNDEKVNE